MPVVNADLLKKHAAAYKLTKETAPEFHKQLFKKHPDVAEAYGAEDIDPDSLGHSQKFVMYGMEVTQFFFKLPASLENERSWRSALSNFKEHYSDVGVPLSTFNS
ncbi:GLOBIN domain-containing protein [Aphelenchoides fujianensis]|nr:GLOBIN domain-containing protein [Aphelenchoides fujianensis]